MEAFTAGTGLISNGLKQEEAIPADVDMGKTTRTCNAEGAGEPSPQPERKAVSCRDTA